MSERGTNDVRPREERGSGGVPDRILLATDGSRGSELAARTAVEYARNFGSRLYLAHVMPVSSFNSGFGPDEEDSLTIYEEDAESAQRLLDKQAENLEGAGVTVEKADLKAGEPGAEILAFAEELGVDLVIVGSRGAGALNRSPMGSVSESIVRHAHCPVLVVREQEPANSGKRT